MTRNGNMTEQNKRILVGEFVTIYKRGQRGTRVATTISTARESTRTSSRSEKHSGFRRDGTVVGSPFTAWGTFSKRSASSSGSQNRSSINGRDTPRETSRLTTTSTSAIARVNGLCGRFRLVSRRRLEWNGEGPIVTGSRPGALARIGQRLAARSGLLQSVSSRFGGKKCEPPSSFSPRGRLATHSGRE